MCGIVAVSGSPEAARLAYLGLYSLQHRGQEAAGIVAYDTLTRSSSRVREAGLVSDVFKAKVFDELPGTTALGHIRYSTAGGAGLKNAQPIRVNYRDGDLALVHNGNLTNAHVLRNALVQEGALFQSSIDSEVIVHLIARSTRRDVDAQIDDALSQLVGAFSVLVTVNDTLYAARDPHGFRPLVLGKMDDGTTVAASETCALDIMGATFLRDVLPGEVLRIRGSDITPLRPLPSDGPPAPCVFELVYFARPDSHLWGYTVDRSRRLFGRQLAVEQPADADIVISVPDSANSAALGYAERSGIPFELGLIRNHYVGRTFIEPTQVGRDFKVRMKYNAVREVLSGQRVVVVDDSLVRGTTSRGLVRMLREAGAREVHFRLASPPVKNPCFYGIDMPTREELIASQKTPNEIAEYLGVESLGYLSREGMLACVADAAPFCTACFDGPYPARLVDAEAGFAVTTHC
ncbi:MAG TPA: amidophosphoribosyltransferase [Longimicrobiaceae bacterium]|jgi:amidophosphoribosyltransferase|nr:amidophosphoribosyltransferase [Longimicrobiaceae bacterium]